MQIPTKFKPFKRDSNLSNANLNHSKEIWSNRMHIQTIQKTIQTIRMQIQTRFEAIECKFEPFEGDSNRSKANSNHLNEIRSNWMQIWTIRKGF